MLRATVAALLMSGAALAAPRSAELARDGEAGRDISLGLQVEEVSGLLGTDAQGWQHAALPPSGPHQQVTDTVAGPGSGDAGASGGSVSSVDEMVSQPPAGLRLLAELGGGLLLGAAAGGGTYLLSNALGLGVCGGFICFPPSFFLTSAAVFFAMPVGVTLAGDLIGARGGFLGAMLGIAIGLVVGVAGAVAILTLTLSSPVGAVAAATWFGASVLGGLLGGYELQNRIVSEEDSGTRLTLGLGPAPGGARAVLNLAF